MVLKWEQPVGKENEITIKNIIFIVVAILLIIVNMIIIISMPKV